MNLSKTEKYILIILSILLFIGSILLYARQNTQSRGITIVENGVEEQLTLAEVESMLAEKRRVDINTADAYDLEALPGIGPALAGRIIKYRSLNGSFLTETDLLNVEGIGEKKLKKIQGYIKI